MRVVDLQLQVRLLRVGIWQWYIGLHRRLSRWQNKCCALRACDPDSWRFFLAQRRLTIPCQLGVLSVPSRIGFVVLLARGDCETVELVAFGALEVAPRLVVVCVALEAPIRKYAAMFRWLYRRAVQWFARRQLCGPGAVLGAHCRRVAVQFEASIAVDGASRADRDRAVNPLVVAFSDAVWHVDEHRTRDVSAGPQVRSHLKSLRALAVVSAVNVDARVTAAVLFRRALVVIDAPVAVVGGQRVARIAGAHVASMRVRAQLAADARILAALVNVFASEVVWLQPHAERTSAEGAPEDVDTLVRAAQCFFSALVNVLTGQAVGGVSAVPLVADAVSLRGACSSTSMAVRRTLLALLEFVILVRARGAISAVRSAAVENPSRAAGAAEAADSVHAFLGAVVQVPLGALVHIITRYSIFGQTVPAGACAVEAAWSVDAQFGAVVDSCTAFVDILTIAPAVQELAVAHVADTVID